MPEVGLALGTLARHLMEQAREPRLAAPPTDLLTDSLHVEIPYLKERAAVNTYLQVGIRG